MILYKHTQKQGVKIMKFDVKFEDGATVFYKKHTNEVVFSLYITSNREKAIVITEKGAIIYPSNTPLLKLIESVVEHIKGE